MRSIAIVLLTALFSAAPGFPADTPPEIKSVIDLARGAPGEFAADAMIRIAALDKLEKPVRVQLLLDAFQRAAEAQEPYKRHAAMTRASSARFLNHVYEQDMDALSLRLRSIQAMLPLDSAKARQMFFDMPPLALAPVSCESFMAYDVSRFYETLADIGNQGFAASEKEKGEPIHTLERYLGAISSPAQVGPAAKLLANAKVSDADFELLLGVYAGTLGKIGPDDRSFTDSLPAGARIAELVEAAKRRKTSPLPLIESYRLYLVNHLSAVRCADDDMMRSGGASFGLSVAPDVDLQATDGVGFFNTRIRMAPLQPIQEAEAAPSKLEGAASGLGSCDDAECRAIREQFSGLVLDANKAAYPEAMRNTPEWQSKLSQFLSALADWKEGADPGSQFREKCAVYGDLYGITPAGPGRELVLRSLLEYLQRSQSQAANRLEWFLPVDTLVGRKRLDPLGTGELANALLKAADPVIVLYAELESIAPRSPGLLMGLL